MLVYLGNIKRAVKSVRGFMKTLRVFKKDSDAQASIALNVSERIDLLERFLVINESTPQRKESNDSRKSLPDGNFLYADDVETPWQDETEELDKIPEQTRPYKLSRDVQQLREPTGHVITQQRYYSDISKYIIPEVNTDKLIIANDR